MLYRPKFCCECGSRIERGDWKLWTSRRFCENCEIDKIAHELFPKIAAGILILFGLFGAGTFLRQPEKPLKVTPVPANATNFSKSRQVSDKNPVQPTAQTAANENRILNVNQSLKTPADPKRAENPRLQSKDLPAAKSETGEPVYFCGAQTKKGTPCSRRVKGGGRCWQHAGQTAMMPPEKLLISQ